MKNRLFNMNLQLFGIFPPGAEPGPNPLLNDSAPAELQDIADPAELQELPAEPAPAPTPAPAPAPAPALDMDALVSRLTEALSAASAPAEPAPAVSEPTPEELEELNSKMRDEFLDNPKAFMDKITAQIRAEAETNVMEKVAPVLEREQNMQKQQELQAQVDAFRAQTPDFDEHLGSIAEYLQTNQGLEDHPNALQIAYDAVKGRTSQDPEAIKTKALSDPALKEAIIKAYLEEVKAGQPPVIVSGSGNLGMPTPSEKPTTLKGASDLFAKSMRAKGF